MEDTSVTIVVTRVVKPGREAEYEAWLRGVARVAHEFPGHQGITVLRPRPGARDFTLIYRFDTVEHLRAWEQSPVRAEWIARAAALAEHTDVQRLTGMEAWFALPGGGGVLPPPRWKMALVTWLVAFPLIQLLNATLGALLHGWPPLLRGAAVGAAMVLAMTFGAMPAVTRLLRGWLYPPVSPS